MLTVASVTWRSYLSFCSTMTTGREAILRFWSLCLVYLNVFHPRVLLITIHVTCVTMCWLAEEGYPHVCVSTIYYTLASTSDLLRQKFVRGEFRCISLLFSPENSNIQLAPLLSALVLAWCHYFLLVAIRSLPRLSYLPTLAKLYSQGFNHLLVMMKELN